MYDLIIRFFARLEAEDGQTMVEYGLILALISVAAIAALQLLGPQVAAAFTAATTAMTPAP